MKYTEDYQYTDFNGDFMPKDYIPEPDPVELKQITCSHIDWKEYKSGRIICQACRLEV